MRPVYTAEKWEYFFPLILQVFLGKTVKLKEKKSHFSRFSTIGCHRSWACQMNVTFGVSMIQICAFFRGIIKNIQEGQP